MVFVLIDGRHSPKKLIWIFQPTDKWEMPFDHGIYQS